MTSGNNGASTPEDDDPFGYLYADGQANGAQPPSGGGYGYPNAVNRVRAVGQRQYGQPAQGQQQTAAYGQVPQQQGAYSQPNAHYAAPETFPGGGAPTAPQQSAHGGGGGRRGPNTKGLLIGAIAVVAAVVIGIGVAMMNGNSDDKAGGDASPTPTTSQNTKPSQSPTGATSTDLPKTDAKDLQLGGGAAVTSGVDGAQSSDGTYVGNLNNVGASVTWTVDGIPKAGLYTLFAHFSVPGQDQSMTLSVNGKNFGSKLNLGNFAHAKDGDFAKGWTKTYSWPSLQKGTNTITLSCQAGDKCNVLLDQLYLKAGRVTS
ncbi:MULTISPECIES: carbohydrate-binding protein [Streptomyces]|uniref:carbohydrate-binding protein n=1 Tax=Streptomyces TaxID=1883 RepID=UPI00201D1F7D|nr:carbohydrate-binding protein [Streptomyces panaciradicis]MCL6668465.1 carbohydrate-binding protein [Streptomyces panaciradicis]